MDPNPDGAAPEGPELAKMRKAMRVTQKKAAAELGLSAATLALGTGETAVDETGEEVLRAPVRIGENAPANCLLTTYRSVGFVFALFGMVRDMRPNVGDEPNS